MKEETFENILRYIRLPIGVQLYDRCTYRVEKQDFFKLHHFNELDSFDKFLVLSDGNLHVVGGVLFYGATDLQVTVFKKYRGKGYMSAIHDNGILRSECYEGQRASVAVDNIRTMDDFLLRWYLLQKIGVPVKNLSDVYRHLVFWDKKNISNFTEESFVEAFSVDG